MRKRFPSKGQGAKGPETPKGRQLMGGELRVGRGQAKRGRQGSVVV